MVVMHSECGVCVHVVVEVVEVVEVEVVVASSPQRGRAHTCPRKHIYNQFRF